MAKARVELQGSQSYTTGGRTFRKGKAEVVTQIGLIERLEAISVFSVTRLDEPQRTPEHDGGDDDEPAESPPTGRELKAKRKKPKRG